MEGIFYGGDGRCRGESHMGGRKRGRSEEEGELELAEIRKVIGRLRDGKAMGMDEIPNEVWRYGGEEGSKMGMGTV